MTKRTSRENGHAERSSVRGTSPSNGYQSKKKMVTKAAEHGEMERWRENSMCVNK